MKTRPLIIEISSTQTNKQPQTNSQNPEHQQKPSNFSIPFKNKAQGTCIVCRKKSSYKCPKCTKVYCSIDHYRTHNLFCSEAFYQSQVKQQLKETKITDKQNKKKVVEMVKQSWDIQEDQENGIDQERLQQILMKIQNGEVVQLGEKERLRFMGFVDKVGAGGNEEMGEVEKMYWEIEEGLSLYLCKSVEIEEMGQWENVQLVKQREILKGYLQGFVLQHPYVESVIRPILYSHLIQLIYSYVLLYRMHNGEHQLFIPYLINFYTSSKNQCILKSDGISVVDFISIAQVQLTTGLLDASHILTLWINQYPDILANDLKTIFGNKLLIMQTLLRIIWQTTPPTNISQPTQIIHHINTQSTSQPSSMTKQQKHRQKQLRKVCKKCQYLLYFVYYFYKKEVCQPYLETAVKFMMRKGGNGEFSGDLQARLKAVKL